MYFIHAYITKTMRISVSFLLAIVFASSYAQKFEGLALTPPMGWNSWNTFQTRLSEQLVKETADMMVSSGMRDAGYTYLVLDDGWSTRSRDSLTGNLLADPVKFPSGMKEVADYVHSKGLKFGLYNCGGTKTCANYPGTYGYEEQDAKLYASWGIDYLKFDWCSSEGLDAKVIYPKMSKAIKDAGRPMIFSLCEWGSTQPWLWAKDVGQLWRTTGDIGCKFDSLKMYPTWHSNGVLTIVDQQEGLQKYTGPGHWNDPDMLEVGNCLTQTEDKAHFSIWCMMAAPLMAGNDLRKMSKETISILTDKDAVAIDQDKLGVAAYLHYKKDSLQIWFKPLENGDWAACFFNRSSVAKEVKFDWKNETVKDPVSGRSIDWKNEGYSLYDVWQKKDAGSVKNILRTTLASHDVLMLRMRKK
jgi:alpha-galactosidase